MKTRPTNWFLEEHLNGAWRPTYFISEKGTLHFTLYPMEHRPHSILQTESALNKEEIRMQEEMEKLYPVNQLEKDRDAPGSGGTLLFKRNV